MKTHRSLCGLVDSYRSAASHSELIPNVIHQHLAHLSRAFMLSLQADAFDGTSIRSATALMAYLRQDMSVLRQEVFRVLFLDGKNRLLSDKVLWTGTVDCVQVHPREIVRQVLELDATAIILVHNHPSGLAKPSRGDLDVTQKIVRVCSALNVTVQDHVIVAKPGCHSMRSSGQLAAMELTLTKEASSRRIAA